MAKTEIGKVLEALIDAGEKMAKAIEAAKDAVKAWEKIHKSDPPGG